MSALQLGPVSVAIEADQVAFQMYAGGVLKGSCDELDHGVLAVGYGEEGGQSYWLVKNSWGRSWGRSGFLKIARDEANGGAGECGILSMPSYPVVDGTAPPSPSPSPAPRPSHGCIFQETEADCLSTRQDKDSEACNWCHFRRVGFGICVEPTDDCVEEAFPPGRRDAFAMEAVLFGIFVAAMFLILIVAGVRRCKAAGREVPLEAPLAVSMQGLGSMEA